MVENSPVTGPRRHRPGVTRSVAACQRCRRRKQKVGLTYAELPEYLLMDNSAMESCQHVDHVLLLRPLALCRTG